MYRHCRATAELQCSRCLKRSPSRRDATMDFDSSRGSCRRLRARTGRRSWTPNFTATTRSNADFIREQYLAIPMVPVTVRTARAVSLCERTGTSVLQLRTGIVPEKEIPRRAQEDHKPEKE